MTNAAADDMMEVSLSGSLGSRRITIRNLLYSFLALFGFFIARTGETGISDKSYPFGDVRRYGAIEGGATNAHAAFQAAAANGRLHVPSGVFAVTGQVTIVGNGTVITGEIGSTISATVVSSDVALFVSDSHNGVVIDRLTITGSFPWAIYISGGSGHRITNNTASGGTVSASAKCGGIYLENLHDFLVADNVLSGNGNASLDLGADIQCNNGDTQVYDGTIRGNRCSSTLVTENIIAFNPRNVILSGNKCSGARVTASSTTSGGYGIALYRTAGMGAADVSGCTINGNLIQSVQGIGIYTQGIVRATIADNDVFDTCSVMTDTSLSAGGIVSESEDAVVANNRVTTSGRSGIVVSGFITGGESSGQLVVGNSVRGTAFDGIVIRGAMADVTIENNVVRDVPSSRLAIGAWNLIDAAITRAVIRGNTMRDVGLGIFLPASSDKCVIEDNIAFGLLDESYIAVCAGTNALVRRNVGNNTHFPEGISPDRGDADATIVVGRDFELQLFRSVLTADRTITLSTINAKNGSKFRIVKQNTAHNLDVGGLKTIAAGTAGFVDVEYAVIPTAGAFWMVTGYGTL
jgi:hypothetical protein